MKQDESSNIEGTRIQPTAHIVVHVDQQPPRMVLLDRPAFTVGREQGNDILIEHGSVSRRHARLEQRDGTWYYRDLGSANGSFHTGQRIQEHVLQDGDDVYLSNPLGGGRVYLTFQALPRVSNVVADDQLPALSNPVLALPPTPAVTPPSSSANTVAGSTADPQTTGAFLTIQAIGQSSYKVNLDRNSLTLGRATQNDILLPQPASRQHGRLERRGTTWHYTDLGSTNGSFLNEKRVTETDLRDGDLLRVGDEQGNWMRLIFHDPAAANNAAAGGQAITSTIMLGDKQVGAPTSRFIGRNPDSDIPVEAPNVSWQHARLDQTPVGFTLVDLGSTNGTFVNGQRITTPRILGKGDLIQIGSFRLLFDGNALQQYDQRRGLRIDVRNMTLKLRNGRKILNDISLTIAPREFVALVGGSGAGKSSLMKAMSGFNRATDGNPRPVQVNGDDYYGNFDAYRSVLGYVPQDDILHRLLPVNRALHYSANLRLPTDTAAAEIVERITRSLDVVEMGKHTHTIVDALSGGQRKRVSIACEMLADPSLFFLDEPTSGLDPGLEKKMMYTLRRLADSGRTVVLVTHATDNITQCDHVALMEMGNLVYFGPPTEALDFFGVTSGSFADIYMYLKAEPGDELYKQLVQGVLRPEYHDWEQSHPSQSPPPLVDLWKARYHKSEQYKDYVFERQRAQPTLPIMPQMEMPGTTSTRAPDTPSVETSGTTSTRAPRMSWWRQLQILTRRYLDLTIRDQRNLAILLIQSPLVAFFILLLAKSDDLIGSTQPDVVQRLNAQSVLFVLTVVGIWFGINNSSSEITKERDIYRRERLSNLSISAYISSKVLVLSLLLFIQNGVLLLIVWMFGRGVDLPTGSGLLLPAWLEIFGSMMLASLAGMSIGLIISTASRNVSQAISLVPLALIPQLLFTGIIFKVEEGLTNHISRIMISRWALDALGTSAELSALCQLPNVLQNNEVQTQCAINETLRDTPSAATSSLLQTYIDDPKGFPFPGAFTYEVNHLLLSWGVLLAFVLVGLVITMVLLKRQDRRL